MKRQWTNEELLEYWTLSSKELDLIGDSKTDHNLLGAACLLKYFQYEGRFPAQKQDVPPIVIVHLAQQLGVVPEKIMLGTESAVDVENSSISITRGFEYAITFPDASVAGVRVRSDEQSGKGLVTSRPSRFAASISLKSCSYWSITSGGALLALAEISEL